MNPFFSGPSTTIAPPVEFMVCVTVVDATTNNPITNVDFIATENGSPSSSELDDPDGEICYSVPGGTEFEVTVQQDGFDDGVRNRLIDQDVNWVIPLNPIVSLAHISIYNINKVYESQKNYFIMRSLFLKTFGVRRSFSKTKFFGPERHLIL